VKVSFEASFARDLKGIRDQTLLRRVEEVIAEVQSGCCVE